MESRYPGLGTFFSPAMASLTRGPLIWTVLKFGPSLRDRTQILVSTHARCFRDVSRRNKKHLALLRIVSQQGFCGGRALTGVKSRREKQKQAADLSTDPAGAK